MKEYIVSVYEDRTVWYNEMGQFHREEGPAIEYKDGDKSWYINGKLHREDGPAVEWDSRNLWFINDIQLTEAEFLKRTKGKTESYTPYRLLHDGPNKIKGVTRLSDNTFFGVGANIKMPDYDEVGFIYGFNVINGVLNIDHTFSFLMRERGYIDQLKHLRLCIYTKEDIESLKKPLKRVFSDRTEWYNLYNQLHREDGPAVEYASGSKSWMINGKLHREDGPAIEDCYGYKAWFINGNRHKLDGPAIEYADGGKEYWVNGILHREDGPAIEYKGGKKEWFVNGKKLKLKTFLLNIFK